MLVRLADPDPVHVAADDGAHPDAALFADFDVADHLGAVVDEGGGVDARGRPAEGAKHCVDYSGTVIGGLGIRVSQVAAR